MSHTLNFPAEKMVSVSVRFPTNLDRRHCPSTLILVRGPIDVQCLAIDLAGFGANTKLISGGGSAT
jgi:hypothetical protein